ncbi:hypothetical protein UCRPC4_g06972 [Phaeomoniella chlamydospora]|uniref:DUF7907 domain-containing protein n=1 Tax=Phaeomoniella chlamydospora TaxID=158046 RepID=A0A0G2DR25_PHACM|nr:hypothetical protein UCRPC4_g06972 [Phaeomoniella chlamydospora]
MSLFVHFNLLNLSTLVFLLLTSPTHATPAASSDLLSPLSRRQYNYTPPHFYLRTCIPTSTSLNSTNSTTIQSDEGLYVAALGAEAGTFTAVLTPSESSATKASLDGTNILFVPGNGASGTEEYGLVLEPDTDGAGEFQSSIPNFVLSGKNFNTETAWEPVTITTSHGTSGFSITSDGKLVRNDPAFAGWLGTFLFLPFLTLSSFNFKTSTLIRD